MNKQPKILFLLWGWNVWGFGKFFVNGRETPHGVYLCLTIFGWGFALADLVGPGGKFNFICRCNPDGTITKGRKLLLGRIRFVPDQASFTYCIRRI